MKIESLQIKNFRVFQDVTIKKLPALCAFIGANGSGKTTLFDVFGFLHDALEYNVHHALAIRGGFKEVVSRAQLKQPIEFEIKFREYEVTSSLVTYLLTIGLEKGAPIIKREVLKYRRGQQGNPWHFLDFTKGRGLVITNERDYGKPAVKKIREEHKLESADVLAIKGLGQFQKFKIAVACRRLIENWYVSDFHVSEARASQAAGYAKHLSTRGENLAWFAQYLYKNKPKLFNSILKKMTRSVPGVSKIEPVSTVDGRIILQFQDGSFQDPFIATHVSDGTIKMFAYLLLLHDPNLHPLLCIKEPENQLYPYLLGELTKELRSYAEKGGQVFVSTHSPSFLNNLNPEEIFWLTKQNGYTQIHQVIENPNLTNLIKEGSVLSDLWMQGFFEGAN